MPAALLLRNLGAKHQNEAYHCDQNQDVYPQSYIADDQSCFGQTAAAQTSILSDTLLRHVAANNAGDEPKRDDDKATD